VRRGHLVDFSHLTYHDAGQLLTVTAEVVRVFITFSTLISVYRNK